MPNLLSRLRGLWPALTRRAFWLWAALITLLRCAVTHFSWPICGLAAPRWTMN